MSAYLFDSAQPWTPARIAAAKGHGAIALAAYIVGSPGGFRCANKADVALIHRSGLGVVPNWERAAGFFQTATIADCKNAGREALAACRALGIPDDGSVHVPFSFDYEVPASGFKHATDQLAACGDGMGGHYQPVGYAQTDLIEHWAGNGLPGPHWLMGSTWRASSQFTHAEIGSPHVAMVQSHDAAGGWLNSPLPGTDINTVTQPNRLLAWWPPDSPYGDTMTPAQLKEILDAINAVPHDTWAYRQNSKTPEALAFLKTAAQDQAFTDAMKSFITAAVEAGIQAATTGGGNLTTQEIEQAVEDGMKQAFAAASQ